MKIRKTPNAQRRISNLGGGESPRLRMVITVVDRNTTWKRLLEFTASIVRLADSLPNTKAGNHIAGQLLRCGTSPLANHGEVEAAESRKDFLHKLRICLKELRETWRWLRLIGRLELTGANELRSSLTEVEELMNFRGERSHAGEKRKMRNGPSEFDIRRSALSVGRFLL
jgi:four helix bundle protein